MNREVGEQILAGMRLTRPEHCPDALWALLERTWAHTASNRPTFASIAGQLAMLRDQMVPLNDGAGPTAPSARHPPVHDSTANALYANVAPRSTLVRRSEPVRLTSSAQISPSSRASARTSESARPPPPSPAPSMARNISVNNVATPPSTMHRAPSASVARNNGHAVAERQTHQHSRRAHEAATHAISRSPGTQGWFGAAGHVDPTLSMRTSLPMLHVAEASRAVQATATWAEARAASPVATVSEFPTIFAPTVSVSPVPHAWATVSHHHVPTAFAPADRHLVLSQPSAFHQNQITSIAQLASPSSMTSWNYFNPSQTIQSSPFTTRPSLSEGEWFEDVFVY